MAPSLPPTLAEVKSFCDIPQNDKDALLQGILDGAIDAVDGVAKRQFRPTPRLVETPAGSGVWLDTAPPVTRKFTTRGRHMMRVPDLRDTSDLVVNLGGQQLPSVYFDLGYDTGNAEDEENPATYVDFRYAIYQYGVAWLAQPLDLVITGRWGFGSYPSTAALAVKIWVASIVARRDARWSDAVQTPEGGVFNYFNRGAPADVKALLGGYRTPQFAGVGTTA